MMKINPHLIVISTFLFLGCSESEMSGDVVEKLVEQAKPQGERLLKENNFLKDVKIKRDGNENGILFSLIIKEDEEEIENYFSKGGDGEKDIISALKSALRSGPKSPLHVIFKEGVYIKYQYFDHKHQLLNEIVFNP